MQHRKYSLWLGAALCVWQLQAAATVDEHSSLDTDAKSFSQKKLEKMADKAAADYGLNPHLFRALITHESRWNARAVSSQNAIGLTQLQAPTAAEFCDLEPDELFDPAKNLDCGARYFAVQLEDFGSVELALCAYNLGPNRVKRAGKCPSDISVTQKYIKTVTETWRDSLWGNVWVLDKWGYHLEDIFDFS
ncbi:MAG: hypothetical protein RIT27_1265 [Pseudomonadota bacterium]|jgi:soluble lytic murein transglycosylase-like protein